MTADTSFEIGRIFGDSAFTEVSDVVHKLRTALLRSSPKTQGVFLTAGAAGSWYFDWIDQAYGPVRRHIAIEKFSPKPESLPSNVEWIPESVGQMSSVQDGSVDVLFSGQNFEHLWYPEAEGFLLEAARVVKPGGWLLIDSPNRTITARDRVAHPEHVVEFTAPEAKLLLEAAGFEVVRMVGLWLCSDPASGKPLPVQAGDAPGFSFQDRLVTGLSQPDLSYVWWAEARRTDREPRRPELAGALSRIFRAGWRERLTRFHSITGERSVDGNGVPWFEAPASDSAGVAMFGPYAPLIAGSYAATFVVRGRFPNGSSSGERPILLEAYSDQVRPEQLGAVRVMLSDREPMAERTISFTLPELVFGVQFRVIAEGGGPGFRVRADVDLQEPKPPAP